MYHDIILTNRAIITQLHFSHILSTSVETVCIIKHVCQGRRRFLKSGTAIEQHMRSARAEGTSGGRVIIPPLIRGVWGISPDKFLKFKMSVEAILRYFETIFACELRLIVQAFHVSVFKRISNPTTKE